MSKPYEVDAERVRDVASRAVEVLMIYRMGDRELMGEVIEDSGLKDGGFWIFSGMTGLANVLLTSLADELGVTPEVVLQGFAKDVWWSGNE